MVERDAPYVVWFDGVVLGDVTVGRCRYAGAVRTGAADMQTCYAVDLPDHPVPRGSWGPPEALQIPGPRGWRLPDSSTPGIAGAGATTREVDEPVAGSHVRAGSPARGPR